MDGNATRGHTHAARTREKRVQKQTARLLPRAHDLELVHDGRYAIRVGLIRWMFVRIVCQSHLVTPSRCMLLPLLCCTLARRTAQFESSVRRLKRGRSERPAR
jgi:hypothetical protein